MAWAQLQLLLRLALLLRHVLWSHTLANWSLPAEDAAELEGRLLPRVMDLLQASATAYWAAVAPLADGGDEAGGKGLDPAQMVVALRIGEGGPSGELAPARRPGLPAAELACHHLPAASGGSPRWPAACPKAGHLAARAWSLTLAAWRADAP